MNYVVTKKIPGGKLLRLKLEADTEIQSVSITGDFFLHPEDALPQIEKVLIGLPAQTSIQAFTQKMEEALTQNRAEFIGVSANDIAQLINETLTLGSK